MTATEREAYRDLPAGRLSGLCQEQTEKFHRGEDYDDRFCFEVMGKDEFEKQEAQARASGEAGMEENARQNPNKVFEVKRVIAEGDLVVTHSHVRQKPEDPGAAVVHIFRFENGKIVELWDLGQPIQDTSVNKNGMF